MRDDLRSMWPTRAPETTSRITIGSLACRSLDIRDDRLDRSLLIITMVEEGDPGHVVSDSEMMTQPSRKHAYTGSLGEQINRVYSMRGMFLPSGPY